MGGVGGGKDWATPFPGPFPLLQAREKGLGNEVELSC